MIATIRRSNPVGPHTDLPNPALDAVAVGAGWYAPTATITRTRPASAADRGDRPARGCTFAPASLRTLTCMPPPGARGWTARRRPGSCGPLSTAAAPGPALAGTPRGHGIVTGELVVDIRDRVPGDTTAVIVSRTTRTGGHNEHVAAALIDREKGRHYAAATSVWFTVATEPAA